MDATEFPRAFPAVPGQVPGARDDLDTLFASLAPLPYEVALFVYLDPERRILGTRHCRSRLRGEVSIALREVVIDALAFDAASIAMAHNHPSGDPTPSDADYSVTRRLARTLDAIGVRLIDHVIVSANGRESFRARGLL